jgi:hypothetical protein
MAQSHSRKRSFRQFYQLTVGNAIPSFMASLFSKVRGHQPTVEILKSFDGYLESGEMLVVLGPPGRYVFSFFLPEEIRRLSRILPFFSKRKWLLYPAQDTLWRNARF